MSYEVIDRIFKRLGSTYGAEFDRSLGGAPIMDVKAIWSHELSGYLKSRESMMAIAWALENLTEKCPNVIQFRNLCRQAPAFQHPALPEPAADPQSVKQELEKLGEVRKNSFVDHKAWAKRIMFRHMAGERIAPYSLQCAREALKQN